MNCSKSRAVLTTAVLASLLLLPPSRPEARPLATRAGSRPPGYGLRPAERWKMRPAPRCHGVNVRLGAQIQRLITERPPRTTFCISRGVHRVAKPLIPKSGDRFVGKPGAVLDGSQRLIGFERTGAYWSVKAPAAADPKRVGQCEGADTSCTLANDVFADDVVLRRVLSLSELKAGSFYFDDASNRIFVVRSPVGHRLELAVATRALDGIGVGAYNIVIRNLIVQKFATEAQTGAIRAGRGWVVEDNEVRLNHSGGIHSPSVTRHNYVHDNGQMGVGGSGPNLLVTGNEIAFNNYAGYCTCWEAGGGKWTESRHLRITNNDVHDNRGPGLWTDSNNVDVLYSGNVVERNTGAGIFHETSYTAVIRNNIVRRNGFAWRGWLEGAGILVNSSPDVLIARNVVADNSDGIGITQWSRGSDRRYGPHEDHNIVVVDNTITMRRGYTGLLQGVGDPSYYSNHRVSFDRNKYRLGCNVRYFVWRGAGDHASDYGLATTRDWRRFGQDTRGRFSSVC
jgi:parallel beta-helix repeat protein